MPQPVLASDNGVILTVGILSGVDRTEMVFPVAAAGAVQDPNDLCLNCLNAFTTGLVFAKFLDCISSDAQVTYVQAEGMVDGKVPARKAYAAGAQLGTRPTGVMSSQVASLLIWYEEAADAVTGERIRVGKNFLPGLSEDDITGDIISLTLQGFILTFMDNMAQGFVALVPAGTFYRGLAANNSPAGNVRRIGRYGVRDYVGTQRRRLTPH